MQYAEIQPIIVLCGRHFVRHHGICNPICVKLLHRMCGVIMHYSMKNEVCILINGRVTANYSISRPPFVRHLGICNPICVKILQLMCAVIMHNSVKNSLYINKWPSYSQ